MTPPPTFSGRGVMKKKSLFVRYYMLGSISQNCSSSKMHFEEQWNIWDQKKEPGIPSNVLHMRFCCLLHFSPLTLSSLLPLIRGNCLLNYREEEKEAGGGLFALGMERKSPHFPFPLFWFCGLAAALFTVPILGCCCGPAA